MGTIKRDLPVSLKQIIRVGVKLKYYLPEFGREEAKFYPAPMRRAETRELYERKRNIYDINQNFRADRLSTPHGWGLAFRHTHQPVLLQLFQGTR